MELKRVKCTICGEPLNEAINGIYKCSCCNSTFKEETTNKEIERIITLLDDNKQEQLANARKNLYNVVNEKYLSKERIREAVNRVKELYPDDIMANFYDSFLLDKETLCNYLLSFDVENNSSYLKAIIEFTIRNLDFNYVVPLKDLVDRGCHDQEKYEYNTQIENEVEKLNQGIYNLDIDRDVFICYSSKDMKKVVEITNFLEESGLSCFVALRNLRHGIGSLENYQENIFKAMRHSKCLVFLSSSNSRSLSCDALKIELPYLKDNLKDVKRIEYLIEEYNSKENPFAKRLIQQTFAGLEWCKSIDDLVDRLMSIVFSNNEEKKETKVDENVKYCVNCFTKNPLTTRHCISCDNDVFATTYEEAKRINEENNKKKIEEEQKRLLDEQAAYKAKLEEEYKKKQEELAKQQEIERLKTVQNQPEYKYCVNCKAKNLSTARFCCECGKTEFAPTLEEIENSKYCTKCFARNVITTKFCSECGNTTFASTLEEAKKKSVITIKKGDTIKFGKYPQSTDTPEPIEWDVLDVVDGKALLFAHKILDAHRFDSSSNNYANSEIRAWLNNYFLNKAFTKEEQERILVTEVDNSERSTNPYYNNTTKWNDGKNKYACKNTQDKIFLLSEYEITNPNYGFNEDPRNNDIKRRKQVTAYAKKNGAWVNTDNTEYKGNGWYFLRSPSYYDAIHAYYVNYGGGSYFCYYVDNLGYGAVPALWIKI